MRERVQREFILNLCQEPAILAHTNYTLYILIYAATESAAATVAAVAATVAAAVKRTFNTQHRRRNNISSCSIF